MNFFDQPATIFVSCHKRLAPYVEQEIIALGFPIEQRFVTGVQLRGTLEDCISLNLGLRSASQVLYSLKKFRADNAQQLYEEAASIPWEEIIAPPGYFSVKSSVDHPEINNNLFANLRIKDAVVDRFRNRGLARPDSGSELSGAVINLHWKQDQAELFIDSSGESLARHRYRKSPGRAPMLEGLAAATILATNWDRNSPFINPMCGSGTLAIEAALIATGTSPGLFRTNFSFMHIRGFDEQAYLEKRGMLEFAISNPSNLKIIASDYSSQAIANAKMNAKAAGVDDLIEFHVCDFYDTPVPAEGAGIVFFNPEYGDRLGESTELVQTYARIGDFLKKRCETYTGYIFTGNLSLAKKIGLRPDSRKEFYNSTIDCRLLEYELYAGSRR